MCELADVWPLRQLHFPVMTHIVCSQPVLFCNVKGDAMIIRSLTFSMSLSYSGVDLSIIMYTPTRGSRDNHYIVRRPWNVYYAMNFAHVTVHGVYVF